MNVTGGHVIRRRPRLVIASKNIGKIRELKALLDEFDIDICSIRDYENAPDVIEDGRTFFENALKKAKIISEFTGETVLADDSGLEVDALDGIPGVYSSRFAGPDASDRDNIEKLLDVMKGVPKDKRGAAFRCVLVLFKRDGTHTSFDGTLKGRIGFERAGSGGFGYDPVFIVPESGCTVAELAPEEKNRISHRSMALQKLKKALHKEINSIRG